MILANLTNPAIQRDRSFKAASFLAKLPLFHELDRDEIKRIAAAAVRIELARGTVLFRRGDPCTGLHIIISGQIKLAFQTTHGGEKVIDILGAGQSFGESVMFLEQPYMVTAEALADTKLLHVERAAILAGLDRDPRLARQIIANLSTSLHHLLDDLESCTLQSGTQRVVIYLLSLVDEGAGTEKEIKLPARKSVIASRLNLTQEHFSRTLHRLAAEGLIAVHGQQISISDVERLRAYND